MKSSSQTLEHQQRDPSCVPRERRAFGPRCRVLRDGIIFAVGNDLFSQIFLNYDCGSTVLIGHSEKLM